MENTSFKIISFVGERLDIKQTTLVYDTINKRIIEKWHSYRLVNDKSRYIITDRFIYSYNAIGLICKVIEIEKGPDDRILKWMNDNNEYVHSFIRIIKNKLDFENQYAEIVYSRNNRIGINEKALFQRSLLIELDINDSTNANIRLRYIFFRNGKMLSYKYSKGSFNELLKIIEYQIILDLRIINFVFRLTGIPLLTALPHIILKRKIKENAVVSKFKVRKIPVSHQDYFQSNYVEEVFVNEVIFHEDLFWEEQEKLITDFENACSHEKV